MSQSKYTDRDLGRVAGIIDEQFGSPLLTVLENIDALLCKTLKPLVAGVAELKTAMKVSSATTTATNYELYNLDKRVTQLEAA